MLIRICSAFAAGLAYSQNSDEDDRVSSDGSCGVSLEWFGPLEYSVRRNIHVWQVERQAAVQTPF